MGVEQAVLAFLSHYGYVALFVLLTLETAMILHFVPGEIIVGVAASQLARSPASLAAVVLDAAAGATTGSLLLYGITRYGGRGLLERLHLAEKGHWLASMERWFARPSGEALVFVLRFVPVVRAVVTIPAALARMDVKRFALYSAGGNLIFAWIVAGSTYAGARSPRVRAMLDAARAWIGPRAWFLLVVGALAAVVAFWLWRRRKHIARAPERELPRAWRGAALATIAAAFALALLAIVLPGVAGAIVNAIARDYAQWADEHGLSLAARAFLVSGELLGVGLLALALTRSVRALVRRARGGGAGGRGA